MCPECESNRNHTIDTAYDDQNRKVRDHQCKDCGTRYTTIEVAIPIAFARVAASKRDYARTYQRRRFGFRGVQGHKPYDPPFVEVRVNVRDPRAPKQ